MTGVGSVSLDEATKRGVDGTWRIMRPLNQVTLKMYMEYCGVLKVSRSR